MALYSSSLHLTPGANISFINNSAQETGGAIHIEPDLTECLDWSAFIKSPIVMQLQLICISRIIQQRMVVIMCTAILYYIANYY